MGSINVFLSLVMELPHMELPYTQLLVLLRREVFSIIALDSRVCTSTKLVNAFNLGSLSNIYIAYVAKNKRLSELIAYYRTSAPIGAWK